MQNDCEHLWNFTDGNVAFGNIMKINEEVIFKMCINCKMYGSSESRSCCECLCKLMQFQFDRGNLINAFGSMLSFKQYLRVFAAHIRNYTWLAVKWIGWKLFSVLVESFAIWIKKIESIWTRYSTHFIFFSVYAFIDRSFKCFNPMKVDVCVCVLPFSLRRFCS